MSKSVSSFEEADFIRLILPPDSGDKLANIKEFYKNGAIKLIGKAEYKSISSFIQNNMPLEGDYITFYPTGHKEKVLKFDSKNSSYSEYKYYPNGKLYSYTNNNSNKNNSWYGTTFVDCYDDQGNIICSNENGKWIEYDNEYRNIILTGNIKNGLKDGDWHGSRYIDSIKYAYNYIYNNGKWISSIGTDKNGVTYPFRTDQVIAGYKAGPFVFLDLFRDHLKIPRDANGKKLSIDSLYISFVVEKNGHLDDLQLAGKDDPALITALSAALAKSPDWTPTKYWGIPLRTKITFPLKAFKADDDSPYYSSILFDIKPIRD